MSVSPALKIVRQSKPSGRSVSKPRLVSGGRSNSQQSIAADEPPTYTMTDAEIGRELRVSAKTIRRMDRDNKMPKPIKVGSRSLRWVRDTILEWLAAGCPDRATFEANRKVGRS